MEDNNELYKYQNDADEYLVFHALPEAESRWYTFRDCSIIISYGELLVGVNSHILAV